MPSWNRLITVNPLTGNLEPERSRPYGGQHRGKSDGSATLDHHRHLAGRWLDALQDQRCVSLQASACDPVTTAVNDCGGEPMLRKEQIYGRHNTPTPRLW